MGRGGAWHVEISKGCFEEAARACWRRTPFARKRWTLSHHSNWKADLLRIQSECWWMFWRVSDEAREHTCASFAWSHTAPWGGDHPKVRVRGSTRVRAECCASPAQSVKRSRDTIVDSASSEKVALGIFVGGQSPSGVPSEGSGNEGVSPPRVVPNLKWRTKGPRCCRRCFVEGWKCTSCLELLMWHGLNLLMMLK